ncbi:MAG: SPOR domain-containing protein [Gallionella sp.]|nr:SPOR domain-containing protein [Gallionella sp.]
MRVLFWILLSANVIFFAMMQWGGRLAADNQAVSAQPALHEEKISLLSALSNNPDAALPASAPVVTSAVVSAQLGVKPDTLCMEWGDFSSADLVRATTVLSSMQLGDKLSQRQIEYNIGYWVYIPPVKDKAAMVQKLAQLKALGVNEHFVVQEAGTWLNAISLGVFKTQEAAQKFHDELRAKGVRSAQVGERASKLKATIFVLNGLDVSTGAKLAEIHKDFSGGELKKIPCAH